MSSATISRPTGRNPWKDRAYFNGGFTMKLPPGRTTYSHMDAWDPATGKRAWTYPYKYVLLASVLATAGNLVFTGNPEGEFFALDAERARSFGVFKRARVTGDRQYRIP